MKNLLFVEDNEDIRTITSIALRHSGRFEVTSTASGREAMMLAENGHFDVVLLDVMMPDMDGVATFNALRDIDSTREVPIVFLTAKAQPSEIHKLLDLGATAVLTKPFDPLALADRLTEIIDG